MHVIDHHFTAQENQGQIRAKRPGLDRVRDLGRQSLTRSQTPQLLVGVVTDDARLLSPLAPLSLRRQRVQRQGQLREFGFQGALDRPSGLLQQVLHPFGQLLALGLGSRHTAHHGRVLVGPAADHDHGHGRRILGLQRFAGESRPIATDLQSTAGRHAMTGVVGQQQHRLLLPISRHQQWQLMIHHTTPAAVDGKVQLTGHPFQRDPLPSRQRLSRDLDQLLDQLLRVALAGVGFLRRLIADQQVAQGPAEHRPAVGVRRGDRQPRGVDAVAALQFRGHHPPHRRMHRAVVHGQEHVGRIAVGTFARGTVISGGCFLFWHCANHHRSRPEGLHDILCQFMRPTRVARQQHRMLRRDTNFRYAQKIGPFGGCRLRSARGLVGRDRHAGPGSPSRASGTGQYRE